MKRMNEAELRAFLVGQTLFAFEPETFRNVAKVTYGADGTCSAVFADETRDSGRFGISGDVYWTRYSRFRQGETHRFFLVTVADDIAQAFHGDGRRAFLQSPHAKLDRSLLEFFTVSRKQ